MRGISANHGDSANPVNTNSYSLAANAHLPHDFAAFAGQCSAKTAGQLSGWTEFVADDSTYHVSQTTPILKLTLASLGCGIDY